MINEVAGETRIFRFENKQKPPPMQQTLQKEMNF